MQSTLVPRICTIQPRTCSLFQEDVSLGSVPWKCGGILRTSLGTLGLAVNDGDVGCGLLNAGVAVLNGCGDGGATLLLAVIVVAIFVLLVLPIPILGGGGLYKY